MEGKAITVKRLKSKLTGKEEIAKYVIEILKEHYRKMVTVVRDEFTPGTLERYTATLKVKVDFLKWMFQVPDKKIRKVNHAFYH